MNISKKIENGEYTKVRGMGSSNVWTYFKKILNTDTQQVEPFVICEACEKIFKYRKGCSPSNLKKHHCYKNKRQSEEESSTVVMNKKPRVTVSNEIREEVVQNCVKYMACDLRSFDTVSGGGFKELARSLVEIGVKLGTKNFAISDILPHSTTVIRRLKKLHGTEIEAFVANLRPIIEKGWCAGTMDMWTESRKQRDFLTVTVHYLDATWHLHNRILCTMEFEKCDENGNVVKKSAENIIRSIEDKFKELKLESNLHYKMSFTTDQGSNIKKALQDHSRINCIAHVLNIILKHTFDKQVLQEHAPHVMDLIIKCKSLVEYLKRSGITQMLETTVKQECSSRWNTKFDMLFSVRQNLIAIEEILEQSGESHRLIGIEKYLLDRVLVFLKHFKSATLLFEGEKKPTIHLVLLHMHILKEKLLKLRDEESNNEVQSIVAHCLDNVFNVKFSPHKTHKIAAFLWPEYKQLRYLNEFEREQVYSIVKDALQDIAMAIEVDVSSNSSSESQEITSDNDDDIFRDDEILTKYKDVHRTNENSQTQINVEIELYKVCHYSENNILHWWKLHEREFPLLSKLARHILCIPASSAASERCFSSANRILEERRTNLKGEHLDAILFLHSQQKNK